MMLPGAGHAVYPWTIVFAETLAAVDLSVRGVRGRFTLPQLAYGVTFAALIADYTAGNITLDLRFGFRNADADVSVTGVNFANLAAANVSSLRSPGFAVGAALPASDGSPQSFVPPRVSVFATGAAATTLDYWILMACVGVW